MQCRLKESAITEFRLRPRRKHRVGTIIRQANGYAHVLWTGRTTLEQWLIAHLDIEDDPAEYDTLNERTRGADE